MTGDIPGSVVKNTASRKKGNLLEIQSYERQAWKQKLVQEKGSVIILLYRTWHTWTLVPLRQG